MNFKINFCDGCTVLINDDSNDYKVIIKNGDKVLLTEFSKFVKYESFFFIDYVVEIYKGENLVHTEKIDLTNKKVKITIDSGALGDNLAWIPQVDRFQKKWNCDLYVDCKLNNFFDYPNINFFDSNYIENKSNPIIPGLCGSCKNFFCFYEFCECYYASYNLGYFSNSELINEFPQINPINIPLGKVASDILGINYVETKPKISINEVERNSQKKYVCISTQSTRQYKYWNNKSGWDEVILYLKKNGYDVVCIDKEEIIEMDGYVNSIPLGAINKTGRSILEVITDISNCDFFIGLSSGLSWLSWSLNKPVVLISGFSNPISEFETEFRVFNENVCNSCWNDKSIIHPNADWSFCPRNKKFECSKEITSDMVIEKINKLIYGRNS